MAIVTSGEDIPTGDEAILGLGVAVVDENVGTGDNTNKEFEMDFQCMEYKNVVSVDGVAKTEGIVGTPEDYVIDYTGGVGGVSKITFEVAPPTAEEVTVTYTRFIEFAAASECSVDYDHDVLKRPKYGSLVKLSKVGAGSATAKIKDVMVDADKLRRFVGSIVDDSPVAGKTKFVWSGASPGTVPWVLVRVLRSSAVVLLIYLKNLQLSSGSLGMDVADFWEDDMSLEVEDFEMVYTTPT